MTLREIIWLRRYRQARGVPTSHGTTAVYAALKWLCAAQDAVTDGGVSRAYSLQLGWELPYPETTGYIIPTFLSLHQRFPELNLRERAWRAGRWLAGVQFASGAICSKQHRPGNTKPSVFNTGMVLHGWVSLLEQKEDAQFLNAACKAVEWLVSEQEADGSWKKNAFNGIPHTYYTMVDWALVRYAAVANDNAARAAAVKNLNWALSHQCENGWFDHCYFHADDPVTTHTLSYTTQGLVECGRLLNQPRFIESAIRSTTPLRKTFLKNSALPGTFDEQWRPMATWECCTGSAQTSLVWQALARAIGDESWQRDAIKLNHHMLRYQKVGCSHKSIDGAIPGSWPISGGYDTFNFPNHAAKFFIDALAGEEAANNAA